ncbi:MAG: type II secretion system protein [Planctomycetota bacterium]
MKIKRKNGFTLIELLVFSCPH